MYYKGDWESVLFPTCPSIRNCIFLLFHISDADNSKQNRVNIYLFYINPFQDFISATINYITL